MRVRILGTWWGWIVFVIVMRCICTLLFFPNVSAYPWIDNLIVQVSTTTEQNIRNVGLDILNQLAQKSTFYRMHIREYVQKHPQHIPHDVQYELQECIYDPYQIFSQALQNANLSTSKVIWYVYWIWYGLLGFWVWCVPMILLWKFKYKKISLFYGNIPRLICCEIVYLVAGILAYLDYFTTLYLQVILCILTIFVSHAIVYGAACQTVLELSTIQKKHSMLGIIALCCISFFPYIYPMHAKISAEEIHTCLSIVDKRYPANIATDLLAILEQNNHFPQTISSQIIRILAKHAVSDDIPHMLHILDKLPKDLQNDLLCAIREIGIRTHGKSIPP